MAQNIDPIFGLAPMGDGVVVVTAPSVVYNGSGTIGTDLYKVAQGKAADGSFVGALRVKYVANATTTSNAAVLKIWYSSINSGATTALTNVWLLTEIALPATGALSTTAVAAEYNIPLGIPLKAGYTILASVTVSQPASCGWCVTPLGMLDY